MRKLLLSLGLSLSFIGLVFLAFNPHIVVEIERKFNPDAAPEIEPAIEADVVDDPEILDVPEGRAEIETSPENLPKNDLPEISNPVLTPPVKPVFPQTLRPNREDLPRLKGYEDIPVSDPWIGETPCSIEIFNPPLSLSTLSPRRDGGASAYSTCHQILSRQWPKFSRSL